MICTSHQILWLWFSEEEWDGRGMRNVGAQESWETRGNETSWRGLD
jgi:hypothetical protein